MKSIGTKGIYTTCPEVFPEARKRWCLTGTRGWPQRVIPAHIEPFHGLSDVQFARLVALVWLRGHDVQRGQP
jgi:hypothetical protein